MRFTLLVSTVWFTFWLVTLLASTAAVAAEGKDLRAQRERFRSLYIQAQSGGWPNIRDSATALESYPLYPYLEAANLEYRLKRGNALDGHLSALFTRHPDLGAAASLHSRWLKDLARRGEWKRVADFSRSGDD
ncbi:MAG: hypothetical protein ACRESW_03095, partial [Nevskiales bacterium]